jgi:hypothetical protein
MELGPVLQHPGPAQAMATPTSSKAMGNSLPDRGEGQRRWLEQLTQQWEADGSHLLRPMASGEGAAPNDR